MLTGTATVMLFSTFVVMSAPTAMAIARCDLDDREGPVPPTSPSKPVRRVALRPRCSRGGRWASEDAGPRSWSRTGAWVQREALAPLTVVHAYVTHAVPKLRAAEHGAATEVAHRAQATNWLHGALVGPPP